MDVWVYNWGGIRFYLSPTPITQDQILLLYRGSKEDFPWLVYHKNLEECKWLTEQVPEDTVRKIEL